VYPSSTTYPGATTYPGVAAPAALSGGGTLTVAATLAVSGVAALSGAGSLDASAAGHPSALAFLNGGGALSGTGRPTVNATAALGGGGTLTTVTVGFAGTAALHGAGNLSAAGSPRVAAVATLTGAGTLAGTVGEGELARITVSLAPKPWVATLTGKPWKATLAMTDDIIHGSIEAIPFNLARNGVAVTDATGITCYLVPGGADWEDGEPSAAEVLSGQLCLLLTGTETAGPYDLYVKAVENPETPVVYAGRVNII